MNKIDTSLIVDPNVQQGFMGFSLAFLQSATSEQIANICIGLIGPNYSTSTYYIINGCVRTGAADGAGSGSASVSVGAIFFNGELFTVPAFTTANINSQNLYIAISDTATDSTPFSDGSTHSVNHVRQIVVTQAASGTTLFNSIQGQVWNYVGTTGQPAFASGVTNSGLVVSNAAFRRVGNVIYLRGKCNYTGASVSNCSVFTLPSGYLPTVPYAFVTMYNNGAYSSCCLSIDTSGLVAMSRVDDANFTNQNFALDGICFSLD